MFTARGVQCEVTSLAVLPFVVALRPGVRAVSWGAHISARSKGIIEYNGAPIARGTIQNGAWLARRRVPLKRYPRNMCAVGFWRKGDWAVGGRGRLAHARGGLWIQRRTVGDHTARLLQTVDVAPPGNLCIMICWPGSICRCPSEKLTKVLANFD